MWPSYPYQTEKELVGDIDLMAKKAKKKRLKHLYPDRRSPYAIDINDSLRAAVPPRASIFQSSGPVIVPTVPLSGETVDVETIPSTPVKHQSYEHDVSSVSETGYHTPAFTKIEVLQQRIKECDGEIAFFEGKLKGHVAEEDRQQYQKEMEEYKEKREKAYKKLQGLKNTMSGDERMALKRMEDLKARQEAEEKARKLEEEKIKLEKASAIRKAESDLESAVNAEYKRIMVDTVMKGRYFFYQPQTAKIFTLKTNKADSVNTLRNVTGYMISEGDIMPKEVKHFNAGKEDHFIIAKESDAKESDIKAVIRAHLKSKK